MAIRSRGFGTPRFTERNMAYKFREEIVGKRFLSVSGFTKLKVNKISEWGWRAGVIRAASHRDNGCHDLQVSAQTKTHFDSFFFAPLFLCYAGTRRRGPWRSRFRCVVTA